LAHFLLQKENVLIFYGRGKASISHGGGNEKADLFGRNDDLLNLVGGLHPDSHEKRE